MSENRAVTLYGINDFKLEKREIPEVGPGELLIKVEFSGLCPSDIKILRYGGFLVKYPVVLGHETAGRVFEVGKYVEDFRVGDRVTVAADVYCGTCENCRNGRENICERPLSFGYNVDGSHADYMIVPRIGVPRAVFKIPNDMSFETASMSEPFACVIHSMNVSSISPKNKVAIIGDGPMGLLHVIAGKIFGASSISVLGLVDKKLNIALKLGADRVYNRKEYKDIQSIKSENNEGFDTVYITVVNRSTLEEAFQLVKKGGKIVIFAGVPANSVTFNLDPNIIHYGEVTLLGSYGYTYSEYNSSIQLLYKHKEVTQIVSHILPLNRFNEAIDIWDNKEESIKILISR
jgi:L-iditol 2-dehydrogenase